MILKKCSCTEESNEVFTLYGFVSRGENGTKFSPNYEAPIHSRFSEKTVKSQKPRRSRSKIRFQTRDHNLSNEESTTDVFLGVFQYFTAKLFCRTFVRRK